jgi:hypothetical protein
MGGKNSTCASGPVKVKAAWDGTTGGDAKRPDAVVATVAMTSPKGGKKINVRATANEGIDAQQIVESGVFKDWVEMVEADPKLFITRVRTILLPCSLGPAAAAQPAGECEPK